MILPACSRHGAQWILAVLLRLLVLALGADGAATLDMQAPWSMRGGDMSRTGRSPQLGPLGPVVNVTWTFTAAGWFTCSPTLSMDGLLFIGSWDSSLYAINVTNGTMKWKFPTGNPVLSSPLIDDAGFIYFGSEDAWIYSLNATTGALRWKFQTDNQICSSPVLDERGVLLIGAVDHYLYAINSTSGVLLWRYAAGNSIYSSPAIRNGTVYVGSWDYNMYALNASTGAKIWNYTTGGLIYYSSPVLAGNDTLYFGSSDGYVYALNSSTGALVWKQATGGPIFQGVALALDGSVIAGSDDQYIYAMDGSTGAVRWTVGTGNAVTGAPVIGSDGTIYIGSSDFIMRALCATTGILKWSYTTGGSIWSSPAIGPDGTAYFGSKDANVYAMRDPLPGPSYTPPSCSLPPSISVSASRTMSNSVSPSITPTVSRSISVSGSMSISGSGSTTNSRSTSNTGSPSSSNTASMSSSISTSTSPSTTASSSPSVTPSGSISPSFSTSTQPSISAGASTSASSTISNTPSLSASLSISPSVTGSMASSVTGSRLPTTSSTTSSTGTGSMSHTTTATVSMSARPTPSPGSLALSLHVNVHPPVNFSGNVIQISDALPPVPITLQVAFCTESCIVNCTAVYAGVSPMLVTFPPKLLQGEASLTLWQPFDACPTDSPASALSCQLGGVTASLSMQCRSTRWPLFSDAVVLLAGNLARSAWAPPFNLSEISNHTVLDATVSDTDAIGMAVAQGLESGAHASLLEPFHMLVTEGSHVYLRSSYLLAHASVGPFSNSTQVFANNVRCNVSWVAADGHLLRFDVPSSSVVCPHLSTTSDTVNGHSIYDSVDCGYIQVTITRHSDAEADGATLSCPPFCPNDFPGTLPLAVYAADGSISLVPGSVGTAEAPPVPVVFTSLPSTGFYMTQGCAAAGFLDPALGICTNASDPRHLQCAFGAGAACRTCPTGALCPGGYRAWPKPGFFTATEASGVVTACPAPASTRCIGWNSALGQVQCGNGYLAGSFSCSSCASGYYPALDGTCVVCPYDGSDSAVNILLPIVIFCASLAVTCAIVYAIILGIARLRGASTTGLLKSTLQLGAWVFMTIQVVAQVGRSASPGMPPLVLAIYTQLSIFQFRGVALPSACVPGSPFTNEIASMSVALAMLILAAALALFLTRQQIQLPGTQGVAIQASKRLAVCAAVFRGSIMCLALLYSTVTNAVISILRCSDVSISQDAYAALIGEAHTSSLLARNTRTVVASLLQSNPSVVCYSGHHASVAVLAWATAMAYCALYPICAVVLVSWRIKHVSHGYIPVQALVPDGSSVKLELRANMKDQAEAAATQPAAPSWQRLVESALCHRFNGIRGSRKVPESDLHVTLARDPLLAPFVAAEYQPRAFWFPIVDHIYFVVLALAQAFLYGDAAWAKFLITTMALLFIMLFLVWHRPYVASWKFVVKVYSLLLCLIAACLNLTTAQNPSDPAVISLAFTVVVLSVGLFLALAAAFVHDVLSAMQNSIVPVVNMSTKNVSLSHSGARRDSKALQPPGAPQEYSNPLLSSKRDPLQRRVRMTPLQGDQEGHDSDVPGVESGHEAGVNQGRARQVRPSVIMTAPQLSVVRRAASHKLKS